MIRLINSLILKNKILMYFIATIAISSTIIVAVPSLRHAVGDFLKQLENKMLNKSSIEVKGEVPENFQRCFSCHPEIQEKFKATYRHVPFVLGNCGDCHKPHNTETGKAEFTVNINELCFTCHNRKEEKDLPYQHVPFKLGKCYDCHDPHGSENNFNLRLPVKVLCNTCHNMGLRYGNFMSQHPPFKNSECIACHVPHASKYKRNLRVEVPTLCYSCHWATLPGYFNSVKHPPFKAGKCLACHHPHATDNKPMLRKPVPDLCLGCHDQAKVIGYSNNMHPIGDKYPDRYYGGPIKCTSCHHPHGTDNPRMWRRPGNKLCFGCHLNKRYPVGTKEEIRNKKIMQKSYRKLRP